MPAYRRKPIIVEARRLELGGTLAHVETGQRMSVLGAELVICRHRYCKGERPIGETWHVHLRRTDATVIAREGDWISRDGDEYHVHSDEEFQRTHELVE